MFFSRKSLELPTPDTALPDRDTPMAIAPAHAVLGTPMRGPFAQGLESVVFALGCFWGAERLFWKLNGVYSTAVGYIGGISKHPTYHDVCSGKTGHTEGVLVVYDPSKISFDSLLKSFWEGHDPTQGMRQGNDVGTQYRSGIYVNNAQQENTAKASLANYQMQLSKAGYGLITTEIKSGDVFYFAEDDHQQYLHKNPNGYCGLGGTGVSCPIGTGV
jgi:peptide-methionine (S)-S-oxide reductase